MDPIVDKTRDAYGYCYQNPINLTDPTGMAAEPPTDYVDEKGNLLLHTEDGSNAVITVTNDKLQEFTSSVLSSSEKGLNTRAWNFVMKDFLVGDWNQTRENIQSWYATPEARRDAVRYWQTGDFQYWHDATLEHTGELRKDILGWASAIAGGLYISGSIRRAALPEQLPRRTFGHTFTTHGEDATEFLINRARGAGKAQGQFLDDRLAGELILNNLDKLHNGAVDIPIPRSFPARIIMPDGTFRVPTHVRLVPGGNGVRTAYPLIIH